MFKAGDIVQVGNNVRSDHVNFIGTIWTVSVNGGITHDAMGELPDQTWYIVTSLQGDFWFAEEELLLVESSQPPPGDSGGSKLPWVIGLAVLGVVIVAVNRKR